MTLKGESGTVGGLPRLFSVEPSITSMDSAATVDGVRLAELAEELPLGRSSLFELLRAFKIVSVKGPGVSGKGRVAWVSTADADRLRAAARAVHEGKKRIADFDTTLARTSSQPLKRSPAALAESSDAAPFLARLEAAERAVSSGLGLTTTELAWILGVIPGSSPVTRGGITATRTGKNCWLLSKAS